MKLANYDSRKHVKKYGHVVDIKDVLQNGWLFTTFEREDFVYVGNGLVQRLYSSAEVQTSKIIIQFPVQTILRNVRTVRNRQTEIIYGRRHPGQKELRKIYFEKKHR
ncbi:hypothetical protein [Macrococcus bovicus]|uniref:hypothetical protein n=1 Tax=Macrococcus bovicus TaxID=69968 RepID=UPI0025A62AE2|nr:hypothetical protein [Macrococcus bovicus]WJP96710.1 hypothetical protein QSV55_00290 [Macrococcus bovicus]